MRIGWYINRLRNMQPAEVLHRLGEQRRRIASRRRDEGWERYRAPQLHPVFGGLRDRVLAATEAQRHAIAAAAADTLSGRFAALGRRMAPARSRHAVSPRALAARSGDRQGFGRGPRPMRSMSIFAMAAVVATSNMSGRSTGCSNCPPSRPISLLEGDGQARAAIEAAIGSWHAANPPFRGVGWASGIEVALRAISLIVTLDLAGDRLGTAARRQAGEILAASAYLAAAFPLPIFLGQQSSRRGTGRPVSDRSGVRDRARGCPRRHRGRGGKADSGRRRRCRTDADLCGLQRRTHPAVRGGGARGRKAVCAVGRRAAGRLRRFRRLVAAEDRIWRRRRGPRADARATRPTMPAPSPLPSMAFCGNRERRQSPAISARCFSARRPNRRRSLRGCVRSRKAGCRSGAAGSTAAPST